MNDRTIKRLIIAGIVLVLALIIGAQIALRAAGYTPVNCKQCYHVSESTMTPYDCNCEWVKR